MEVLAMECGHHFRGIRILAFIEPHGIPAVLAPVLPILNEHVDGNLAACGIPRPYRESVAGSNSAHDTARSRKPTAEAEEQHP